MSNSFSAKNRFKYSLIHVDGWLLFGTVLLACVGLWVLYSASDQNGLMVLKQSGSMLAGLVGLFVFAQIPPERYRQWAPLLFGLGVLLLLMVLVIGHVGQGARRWIGFAGFRFQPSEIMKLAMPMMMSWILSEKPLPAPLRSIGLASLALLVPVLLTAKQPDLGTAIVIGISGLTVLIMAGIDWRLLLATLALGAISTPILWHFMHEYQKQRVLIFLNPERSPLGAGYNIIQSKIAIGSGGFTGKGWLHGTQSHLAFLPTHTTDFIFAVVGEELGFLGASLLLLLFLAITARCLYISSQAQTTFTRLLSGSLSVTFISSALINMGMVTGILPVVGVPLPLVSYGGSSIVTLLLGFGIMMSIQTHKKLWSS